MRILINDPIYERGRIIERGRSEYKSTIIGQVGYENAVTGYPLDEEPSERTVRWIRCLEQVYSIKR